MKNITKPKMEKLMKDLGLSEVRVMGVNEIVYQLDLDRGSYAVRVYSSISRGRGRAAGSEDIRVVAVDIIRNYVIKMTTVKKEPYWEDRVASGVAAMREVALAVREMEVKCG